MLIIYKWYWLYYAKFSTATRTGRKAILTRTSSVANGSHPSLKASSVYFYHMQYRQGNIYSRIVFVCLYTSESNLYMKSNSGSKHSKIAHWSFVEKTSVKQHLKRKACFKFQMFFLHLVRQTPRRWGFGSAWHFVRSLVWCTPKVRLWVRLTFLSDFGSSWSLSDVPPKVRLWDRLTFLSDLWVTLTFGQTYPTPWMRLQVRLTFGQTLVRCTPQ